MNLIAGALGLTWSASVAGSHTTSGSITLLLSHLLDNPATMKAVVDELDRILPTLGEEESYGYFGLEASLPFTQACVNESFRLSPVVSIPLSRKIAPAEGRMVDGHHLPAGVSSHSHYCLNKLTQS